MSDTQDKRYLVRLDPALFASVEEWAKEDRRSINNLISFLIAQAVERKRADLAKKPSPPPVTA
jgi:hypothetical protein